MWGGVNIAYHRLSAKDRELLISEIKDEEMESQDRYGGMLKWYRNTNENKRKGHQYNSLFMSKIQKG